MTRLAFAVLVISVLTTALSVSLGLRLNYLEHMTLFSSMAAVILVTGLLGLILSSWLEGGVPAWIAGTRPSPPTAQAI